ncbi:NGG1p interacting factor NIF3 [Candidatus Peregrinibacteria bacterium]|nr:NGG1p interacting factor NIF3 [Candidatus Peregrinibacteria bacterium]
MLLNKILELGIEMAIAADPRGKKEIAELLKRRKANYEKLDTKEKVFFDMERLKNPYDDSRIHHKNSDKEEIKTVFTGIDMDSTELLLAHELNKNGRKIDLVLGHHPKGRALLNLGEVMDIQNDIFAEYGVPINVAEKLMNPRIDEIARAVHPINFLREIDTAKLLGLNYANTHTIADNLAYRFLKKNVCDGKKYRTVGDVIETLVKIPEYKISCKQGNPPIVASGDKNARAGNVAPILITGGTSGSEKIYEKLSHAGVGTAIGMHLSEKHREEAEKFHINVIVAGHIASDSLGMNLFLDQIEKKGVKIIPCGMIRVKR